MMDIYDIILASSMSGGSGSGSGSGSGTTLTKAQIRAIDAVKSLLDKDSSYFATLESNFEALNSTDAAVESALSTLDTKVNNHEARIAALEEGGTPVVPPAEPTTWELFRDAIPDKLYAIGDQIIEKWNDLDWIWEVADYGTAETADGVSHECVILQGHHSCPAFQFDAPEQKRAEGNYEANLFYYVADETATSGFKLKTDYEVGAPIEGDVYVNDIKDESGSIIAYGCNDWALSAYRMWLNADGKNWYSPTHEGDCAPEDANKNGFLMGFSQEFRDILKPVKVVTNGKATYDKIYLASAQDVYGESGKTGLEYWKKVTKLTSGSTAAKAARAVTAIDAPDAADVCKLRTPDKDTLHRVCYIKENGAISTQSGARKVNPGLVLCAICV